MSLKSLFRFLLPAFVFCLLLGAASAEKTVVMLYLCGSNLESQYGLASRDLQEILDSGYDRDETEVLVLSGGSRVWHYGMDTERTSLYRVSPGYTLVEWRSSDRRMNMGDPETLSWFLSCGRESFQADRYALVLWNHGGGPLEGVCWDELYSDERLTLPELVSALENSPFRDEKLEWIGFDACLMSSLEVANRLAPYARYMIASQEREPGSGWSYSFLRGLEADRNGGETGRRIIDAYFDGAADGNTDRTLSCVDLREAENLCEAMESFFEVKKQQVSSDSFPELSRLRQSSRSFGVNRAGDNDSYDLVDLGGLLVQLQADDSLLRKLEKAVVYSRSNVSGASGLCVYHPLLNTAGYTESWKQFYEAVSFSKSYKAYIQSFGGILTGERLVYWNNLVTEASESGFTCRLTEEQAASWLQGRMTVMGRELEDGADDSWYLLYTTDQITLDDQNVLHGTYPGKALYLTDSAGQFEVAGPIEYQMRGDCYYIPLYPCDENREIVDTVLAVYTLDPDTGSLVPKEYLIYDWILGNFTSRAEIDFSRYAGIVFERYSRNVTENEYGEIVATPYWPRDMHISTQVFYPGTSLHFRFVTHDQYEGVLQVLFEIQDVQANWIASRPVQVSHTVSPLEISLDMEQDERLDVRPFGWSDDSRLARTTPLGMVVSNRSDTAMTIQLTDTSFNGISLDISLQVTVSPGETGVLSFPLDLDWLPWLRPQRILRQVSGTFVCWPEGQEAQARRCPYTLATGMSLASMYRSTAVLPSESADWASPLRIAEGETWQVSVLGISSLDGRLVLTLEYENHGSQGVYFCPDCVQGNGLPWHHGEIQFSKQNGYGGNGLRILPGQSEYAPPLLYVPAGETLIDYVQFTPEEAPCVLNRLSFRIHLYDQDGEINLLTEKVLLSFPESVTVAEGVFSAVSGQEALSQGPVGAERYGVNDFYVNAEVLAPAFSSEDIVTLFPYAEPDGAVDASYTIVSLISSEDVLCARGFYLPGRLNTDGPELSRTPLMIPLQTGRLAEKDGRLQAECLPWIAEVSAGGEDTLALYMLSDWLTGDLLYQESLNPVSFFSSGSGYYPDQVSEISVGLIPVEGAAFFSGAMWHKYGAPGDAFDMLRLNGSWPLVPEEAWNGVSDSGQWAEMEGYQSCTVRSGRIQVRMRKPSEEDRLYVLYEWTGENGRKVTLPPVPLSGYLSADPGRN